MRFFLSFHLEKKVEKPEVHYTIIKNVCSSNRSSRRKQPEDWKVKKKKKNVNRKQYYEHISDYTMNKASDKAENEILSRQHTNTGKKGENKTSVWWFFVC